MPDVYMNLRAALTRFDRYHRRWEREFERMLGNLPKCQAGDPQVELNNAAVHRAFENCGRYRLRAVAPAFHAATADVNSKETCEMVFRYEPSSGHTDVPAFVRKLAAEVTA